MYLTNDELYQLVGRIFGRMKHWASYVKTEVFCTRIIMDRVIHMEACSRNMIENHNGDTVTLEDYEAPINDRPDILNNKTGSKKGSKKGKPKTTDDTETQFKRIPVIVNVDPENELFSETIKKKKNNKDKKAELIKTILSTDLETYGSLYHFINDESVICELISYPGSQNSIKKHITASVNAKNESKTFSIDLDEEQKVNSNWQVWIDSIEHRLCFVLWSRNPELY
jgi:hypothetical protein